MGNVLKGTIIFLGGMIAGVCFVNKNVEAGDVVYEDDDKYIRASDNKTGGWSHAQVHWKKPIEK